MRDTIVAEKDKKTAEPKVLTEQTHSGVDRALEIIDLLTGKYESVSITDISRELGITRATAYTIVNSLLVRNYLERDPEGKRFILGYAFYNVGKQYRFQYPFLNTVEQYLIPLFDKWKIRLNVAVLKEQARVLIILTEDSHQLAHLSYSNCNTANASASGRVLLAYQPQAVREEIYRTVPFRKYTPQTVTEPAQLEEECRKIRSQGFAYVHDQLVPFRASIAVPVFDKTNRVIAAITFADMESVLGPNQKALVEDLFSAGSNISSELGCANYGRCLLEKD